MKRTHWLQTFTRLGIQPSFSQEEKRRVIVINLFALIGSSITGALGLRALIAQEIPLAISLLTASFVFIAIRGSTLVISGNHAHRVAEMALTFTFMVLMLFLVVSGGKAHTGPLWMLVLPPVTLFLNGLRNGLIMLLGFLLIVAYLFFITHSINVDPTYGMEFKKRLVYVFITVTLLSSIYEYSRQHTYAQTQRLKEKFERQASYDPLTKLLNRRGLITQIKPVLARAERQSSPTSLVLMDIDRFKKLNDTYGHDAGDDALVKAADMLNQRLRTQDYACRWGGEEFLLVLPDTPKDNAIVLANEVRAALAALDIPYAKKTIRLTASFGVSELLKADDLEPAISKADDALYDAKSGGRNCVKAV